MMAVKKFKTILALLMTVVFVLGQTAVFAADGQKARQDIEDKYKWKLEDIYSSADQWTADFQKIQKDYIPSMEQYKSKLTTAAKVLACLKLSGEMSRLMEKVYVYAHMKLDENQADNAIAELSSKSETLYSQVGAAQAFIQPELLSLQEDVLKGFMNDTGLGDYKRYFDALIKQKNHTLSKSEEELLAMTSDMAGSPNDIYNKLKNADLEFPKILDDKGKEIQLTQGLYGSILDNPDREYRKRAFEGIFGTFNKAKNTFAASLNAEVKKNIFYAKARKYNSALEASLAGENIPVSVYDNLVKAVNNNVSYLHQYVDLRKKVLGIDTVQLYDMYVPLVENTDITISYEEAKKLILEGLKPLGKDYNDLLTKGFNNRWIDVYETANKATGGYQWGSYDTHPYILLNYFDSADDMFTLSHEMGHALNAYYSNSTQQYINSNVPIFTAEVASTTNEILMNKYMLKNAKTDDEKLFYINKLVEQIRGSVYTQVMYSEFEKNIHERVESGEALSAKTMNDIWKDLMQKYFGTSFTVNELAPLWWSRIPHFYMNFYVYKYATSMAASYEIAQRIESGKDVDKYLEFLKSGSSEYPIETLKKLDVDMNSTQAIDNLLKEFGSLVGQMQSILDKKGALNKKPSIENITVIVNGTPVSFSVQPRVINGRTMVPLRKISEAMDVKVGWDGAKGTVTLSKTDKTIVMKVNCPEVMINGNKITLETPPTNIEGSVFVPVRFFAEALGAQVKWDDKTKTVDIAG